MSGIDEENGPWLVSGDYEGNLEEIAKALNGLFSDQDDEQDGRFVVRNKRIKSIGPFAAREVSLAELSKMIAPLLTRGTLELVSVCHYKTDTIEFEKLAIRSDGCVQRQSQKYESGPRDKWRKRSTATYKPRKFPANDLRGTNSGDLIQKVDFGKEAHAGEIR